MARLLILLWEHELDLLRHAHGAGSDDELVAQLLEYTTRTLKVRREKGLMGCLFGWFAGVRGLVWVICEGWVAACGGGRRVGWL